jgi:hypothetical protein
MSRRPSYHQFWCNPKFLPVEGINCQIPEALLTEKAPGLNALSIIGSKAISEGIPLLSTSSII